MFWPASLLAASAAFWTSSAALFAAFCKSLPALLASGITSSICNRVPLHILACLPWQGHVALRIVGAARGLFWNLCLCAMWERKHGM